MEEAARQEFEGRPELVTKLKEPDAGGTANRILANLHDGWPDVAAQLFGPMPDSGAVVVDNNYASTSTDAKATKRSTKRGDGDAKLVAALTNHHQYADGGCLNQENIGNNELARLADVSESTASAFFNKRFKGHAKYRAVCRDKQLLISALKLLNQDYSPWLLFEGALPSEADGDDE